MSDEPVVSLLDATLRFGDRVLWTGLTADIRPGEFVAILGPNGAGKSSLINVLLGLQRLTSGQVLVGGRPPRRGASDIGYVPQQKGFDRDVPLRGRDLVRLGLDGHRFGPAFPSRRGRGIVQRAIDDVGAGGYADKSLGRLSGGEQQRLRIAQAILGGPRLLLCDEPLLSLDLRHQRDVTDLLDRQRRDHKVAVLMVTHEINPVLPVVDRVIYLVGGRWAIGSPAEIMTSERLTELYDAPIDVIDVRGRIVVVGAPDAHVDETIGGGHHDPGTH